MDRPKIIYNDAPHFIKEDVFEIIQSNYKPINEIKFHFNYKWKAEAIGNYDVAIFKVKRRENGH